MKKFIKNWLGITQIERKLNEIEKNTLHIQSQQLDFASDLARLILDVKKDSISLQSLDFICRMNINMKDVANRIPMDYVK